MPEMIEDEDIVERGYTRFNYAAAIENGTSVQFGYDSGAQYIVPLKVILGWYEDSKGEETRIAPRDSAAPAPTSIVECSVVDEFDRNLVRILLDNEDTYDIAWDVVLMACEPSYEHFGGFTEKKHEQTRRVLETEGPFRVL